MTKQESINYQLKAIESEINALRMMVLVPDKNTKSEWLKDRAEAIRELSIELEDMVIRL